MEYADVSAESLSEGVGELSPNPPVAGLTQSRGDVLSPRPAPDSPRILLGVTGAIACYKACSLVRLMVREGWQVRVVPTPRALDFVGEITWRTLSQHAVERDAFGVSADWHPRHIELAGWCDLFVVAPCSANTLAKLAHGLADNLLAQTALACRRPLVLAPAMNAEMWRHPATQANAEALKARGARLLDPEAGELACGVCGTGRLPEPEALFSALKGILREAAGKPVAEASVAKQPAYSKQLVRALAKWDIDAAGRSEATLWRVVMATGKAAAKARFAAASERGLVAPNTQPATEATLKEFKAARGRNEV